MMMLRDPSPVHFGAGAGEFGHQQRRDEGEGLLDGVGEGEAPNRMMAHKSPSFGLLFRSKNLSNSVMIPDDVEQKISNKISCRTLVPDEGVNFDPQGSNFDHHMSIRDSQINP